MTPPPTSDTPASGARRVALILALGALGFVVVSALDRPLLELLHDPGAEHEDWWRALRSAGYLPVWIAAAVAWVLVDDRRDEPGASRWTRGSFLFLGAAASGLAAELAKLAFRRLRPDLDSPGYRFRPLLEDTFSSSGLGLPSSHAAVAFGAAFALCVLLPRGAPVWIAVAIGCGLSRIADAAHYPSDVYGAALIALVIVSVLARALRAGGGTRA